VADESHSQDLVKCNCKNKIPLLTKMSAVVPDVKYSTTIIATPLFLADVNDVLDN
jgi:hypothetical protein